MRMRVGFGPCLLKFLFAIGVYELGLPAKHPCPVRRVGFIFQQASFQVAYISFFPMTHFSLIACTQEQSDVNIRVSASIRAQLGPLLAIV